MSLTVLNVAYPLAPVGPDAAGGAEQVLTHLDAALVRAGHRSLVLACEGSQAAGELIATPAVGGPLTNHMHAEAQARHRFLIERVVRERGVDVVHLHGIDFHTYLPGGVVPVLVTLHLPAAWHAHEAFGVTRPGVFLHCVSRSQQAGCPRELPLGPVIENGVPLDAAPAPKRRGDFVLTLSRICPEKGVHLALAAAEQAGVRAVVAGRVFPFTAHEDYFAREIRPRLGARAHFAGAAGVARKRRLLRAARALLVASTAPETSSLVAMEALAAGKPVIAFAVGALPEIVTHGRTGFLVRDVEEMAAAIRRVDEIDPAVCRAEAARRFSVERMTADYLRCYAEIAAGAGAQRAGEEVEDVAA